MEGNTDVMNYQSNIQTVVANLKGKLLSASQNSAMLRTIATDLLASNKRRIHNDGIAVDGTQIGHYDSTHPLYVNPNKSPRKFKPEGKTGRTIFESTGKPHRSKYFKSYSDYRTTVGREVSHVNLQLSGKLLKDFKMVQDGNVWNIGFMSEYGSDVSRGNEKRFGKLIWGVTTEDEQHVEEIVKEFVAREFNA